MLAIWGANYIGKVDQVPGLFHVQTRFTHVFFVPLFPEQKGCYLVVDEVEAARHAPIRQGAATVLDGVGLGPFQLTDLDQGFRGYWLPRSWKSIGFAYVRAILTVLATGASLVAMTALSSRRQFNWEPMVVAAALIGLLYGTYWMSRANRRTASKLAAAVGIPEDKVARAFGEASWVAVQPRDEVGVGC